jgi:hypothetical protein
VPIIGCVPTLEIFSANSNAPHKFEVSQRPNDFNLFDFEKSCKSSIFTAPSHIEYCECILR